MYTTSDNYKSVIYNSSTKHSLKIYINNEEVNSKYILDYKSSLPLFSNNIFELGTVSSQSVELKLYKNAVPEEINSIYITSGIEDEEIPIGYFNIDDISKDDDYTVTLKLLDNMVKFEFNYNGSELIYPCDLMAILKDICLKAEVELGSTSFLNQDKQVAVYDNTVSAREYISYIAEQAGGFATIGRDGKLYIKTIGENISELPINYFKDFKWGEKIQITRIRYEDGVQLFEKGNDTGNTIYINQDNMYIINQEQIDNIYEKINGLEVYSFEGTSIIDPSIDVGDLLLIDDKYVVYQGSLEYGGKFKVNIDSKIQCKAKEETTTRTPSQKKINRRVQSQIDQAEGKITLLTQETNEHEEKIAQHEVLIGSINSSVKLLGGNNKQRNSIGAYGTEDFEQSEDGTIVATEEEILKSKTDNGFGRIIYIGANKWFKFKSESLVIGEIYTISFKYSNILNNNCKIILHNNVDTILIDTLEEKELENFEYTFIANTEFIELEVITGDYTMGITDYYLQTGDIANKWQPAAGEALSTVLSIYYNGIEVTSANSEIVTQISNLGFSVTNNYGKILITFNKDKCILSDTDINGTLNQSDWLRYVQTINGKEILLEVKI